MKKYVCSICGFVYDEAVGIPSAGIAPGTRWEDLPKTWVCPLCGATKAEFRELDLQPVAATQSGEKLAELDGDLRELTVAELSALCSNLARGCEKQYLSEEAAMLTELADYFQEHAPEAPDTDCAALLARVEQDLDSGLPTANAAARAAEPIDRGALRALVWSEKVTRILQSLLARYEREGDAFLERTQVYVCSVCGFVYVGDEPPALCPVCKVPSWKFDRIEGR